MALSRLYYTRAEVALDDVSTTTRVYQSLWYALFSLLTGLKLGGTTGTSGAPPVGVLCEIDSTCNSVTAGAAGDGVNHLGAAFDATKLVRSALGATPKTWAVVKMPTTLTGLAVPFYLTLGMQGATEGAWYMALSKIQPSGGTVNVIPTAADQVIVWNTSQIISDLTTAAHKVSIIFGANGSFWFGAERTGQGKPHTFAGVWDFSGPEISGDLFPACVFFASGTAPTRGALGENTTQIFYSNGYNTGGVATGTGMGTRSRTNALSPGSAQNSMVLPPGTAAATWYPRSDLNEDGLFEAIECRYMFVNNAANLAYLKGTLPDWWFANSSKPVGQLDPSTGVSELICYGHLWLPNGGAVHVM